MLKFKEGVSIFGLQPEILWAIDRATEVFAQFGRDCVVTSARGDVHSRKSRHYSGLAVDLRIRHLGNPQAVADGLAQKIGEAFDVVLESTHIHVEYDPKTAPKYLTRMAS